MSLPSNHFYLEIKLPESIYLVQSVYRYCTPEPRTVSGKTEDILRLIERKREEMNFKGSAQYKGSLITRDCFDYTHHYPSRQLFIDLCLHDRVGLWLDLVNYPPFQFTVFGSFRLWAFFFTHETRIHTQTQGYLRLTTKNQTC